MVDGERIYDPVPITISIHDEDTNVYSTKHRIQSFCGLSVAHLTPSGRSERVFHPASELSWVEVTGSDRSDPTYWPYNSPVRPWHGVCHPRTEDCAELMKIHSSSEWHGQLLLDGLENPEPRTLELIAWVSDGDRTCEEDTTAWLALRNYARLTFAVEPLPRFAEADEWIYGDLHYHSQSTDNEGESGYAYRAVATTLAAMGVDFVYATDHASDSEQIVDANVSASPETFRGVRDLSQPRWDAAIDYLHGPDGANHEGATFASTHARVPRIFLGAEVDVMPELETLPPSPLSSWPDPFAALAEWKVPYGNKQEWNLLAAGDDGLCGGRVDIPGYEECPYDSMFEPFVDVNGRTAYLPRDIQGINSLAFGRQHILHLPRFRDQPSGFVGSRTTRYGGGSRHLLEDDGVLDEVDAKQGVAFLAHPLGAGGGGKGPGMLPYTQYQYEKIFSHPAFSGLQLWNENNRVSADAGEFGQDGYTYLDAPWESGTPTPGFEARGFTLYPVFNASNWKWNKRGGPESSLHHGTAQWDRLLRWGLDLGRTRAIDWLGPDEPRRLFMAGGSDAHGDFNYRREGYMIGISKVTDDAIAKVRNLVEAGAPRGRCSADGKCYPLDPAEPGHSQDQVADSLAEGHFSITDGPALRVVVDRNKNGAIDGSDFPMGSTMELFNEETLTVLVEVQTTAEFGPLDRVDLYVGVDRDPPRGCEGTTCTETGEVRARTYAPIDHGVRGWFTNTMTGERQDDPRADDCGDGECQMDDGYWLPQPANRTMLRATPMSDGLGGETYRFDIDPDAFPTGGAEGRPTRLYLRAFARTKAPCSIGAPYYNSGCDSRYAYSNPIWALRKTFAPGTECPFSDRALDRDLDSLPDICDQFPEQPGGGNWTRVFGGTELDQATASAIDGDNNVWVVGTVRQNVWIEGATGTSGTTSGTTTANGVDSVVLEYSPTGRLLGRAQVGGAGTATITDIAIRDNAVYITGTSEGAFAFGGFSWTSTTRDPFVARLRRSDLGVELVTRFPSNGQREVRAIAVGGGQIGSVQIAVLGDFSGTWSTVTGITADGPTDCFLVFLDENLTIQSMPRVRGAGTCTGRDIVVDGLGQTTAMMAFDGTLVPSSSISRTTAGTDTAIVRYAPRFSGFVPQWGTVIGSPQHFPEWGDAGGTALATRQGGGVVIAGSFSGNLVVSQSASGQPVTVANTRNMDGFAVELDSGGRYVQLPAFLTGPGSEALVGIASDATGRLVLTGSFTSASATLNGATITRSAGGTEDYILTWLARAPALPTIRQLTASSHVTLGSLSTAASGDRAAFASTFMGTAQFDDRRIVTSFDPSSSDGAVTLTFGPVDMSGSGSASP